MDPKLALPQKEFYLAFRSRVINSDHESFFVCLLFSLITTSDTKVKDSNLCMCVLYDRLEVSPLAASLAGLSCCLYVSNNSKPHHNSSVPYK